MTKQEMIELARQAGFERLGHDEHDYVLTNEIVAFAKLVAEHEREACAKLCDYVYVNIVTDEHIKDMAFKIRLRGQE